MDAHPNGLRCWGKGCDPRVLREHSGACPCVAAARTRGFCFSGPRWTWSNKGRWTSRAQPDVRPSLGLYREGPRRPRGGTRVSHCSAFAGLHLPPRTPVCPSLPALQTGPWTGDRLCLFCVCCFTPASCKSPCAGFRRGVCCVARIGAAPGKEGGSWRPRFLQGFWASHTPHGSQPQVARPSPLLESGQAG